MTKKRKRGTKVFNVNKTDRINNVVKAIAFAEGCINKDESYNKFSLPYRLNNPCDLKVTRSEYHAIMDGCGKLRFADIGTGWNAGYHQVYLMVTNTSEVYKNTMTFEEIAMHYAREHDTLAENTNAEHWAQNVAVFLGEGVSKETRLIDYISSEEVETSKEIKPSVKTSPLFNKGASNE